jgi:hypothetical protein
MDDLVERVNAELQQVSLYRRNDCGVGKLGCLPLPNDVFSGFRSLAAVKTIDIRLFNCTQQPKTLM